ncbi:MAG: hypothetical protein KDI15_03325 [Thiothrix sp.]|nr:hypothetical protein [Thiothrix sp.]HPE61525.1 hypothetical protein [Thiolinea sp.]
MFALNPETLPLFVLLTALCVALLLGFCIVLLFFPRRRYRPGVRLTVWCVAMLLVLIVWGVMQEPQRAATGTHVQGLGMLDYLTVTLTRTGTDWLPAFRVNDRGMGVSVALTLFALMLIVSIARRFRLRRYYHHKTR